ncbi:SDR family oxidoreductase [Ensifer sp. ENS06]|uniref:SDR family oxidoreductase n=1 Tax=Ensifer sp. ENS06 TaxID=2769276 RepID=UPI000DE06AFE|nr:SDR family oxidoreductase [Ensifer sp. ENS06]MBD9624695.1 SDR family oxidoreductase [Ensifer sp. ENS06]
MGRLSGKITLITGAASGIGRETARLFAREGAFVFLADIDAEKGRAAATEIGDAAQFVPLNVTDEDSWTAALEAVVRRAGQLDVLVNSAGIWTDGDFVNCSLADWQRTMAVNATGTFLGCRAAVGAMKSKGNSGSIVNISSVYGNIASDDAVAYAASKGAVRLLTKGVALYCAANGMPVRCNSVHPTYVDSEMLERFAEEVGGREVAVAGLSAAVPMRMLPVPSDIAEAILFLASDAARLVTGTELPVDGGMLAGIVAPVSAPAAPAPASA